MRRRLALAALSIGLPVVALGSAAEALPGLGSVSLNRTLSSPPVAAVAERLPGPAAQPDRSAAQRRQNTRARRAALVARWQGVADCESGGNWSINTGNGYYGGLQFSLETWQAYGGRGMPHRQPAWYQSGIAERVRAGQGLGAWPHCGSYYRG
jgi:hypothetical protein